MRGMSLRGVIIGVFRKNAENSNGGRPTIDYYLTVSCMEFFIVRKVRPVFEVYRQVSHKTVKNVEIPRAFLCSWWARFIISDKL